jgi:hyperosmotically inducible periplasmic protein
MRKISAVSFAFGLALLVAMAGCGSAPPQPVAGDAFDDGLITVRVKRALFEQQGVNLNQVEVATQGGRVQLSGFVPDEAAARAAEEAARGVQGVRTVLNELRVR